MQSFPESKLKILYPLILSLFITAAYIPTFSGEFILDDRPLVKDNLFIREFKRPAFYLSHEDGVRNGSLTGYHTGYYRPLINLFYTIDFKIWGMNPSGFRTTNLILHLFTCIILYQLLFTLLGGRFIAFAITLLFGLHPANTESVAFICARNNILVTLFSLISFYYYLKNSKEKKIWAGLLSYLAFAGAVLCKEFAVMLLPIFFLYNRFMVNNRKILKDEIFGYIPFILILFFYFILRISVTSSLLTPSEMGHLSYRVYFTPYLIVWNLKLIFFPYGLHSFGLSYPSTFFDCHAILSNTLVFLMGAALWIGRNNRILLFSGLSFLAIVFPVLNIIPTASISLVAMRWLYLPITFISIGAAWIIQKAIVRRRMLTTSLLCITVFYFGTYSYFLNKNLWHDEATFYNQEVRNFNNYLYAGGLAERLLDNKKYREAERYFQIAIKNYPNKAKNYINYSALLIDTGRPDAALMCLNKAKALFMTHNERGEWFNNMGMAYFRLKKQDKAIKNFKKAVIFSPNESEFWANLGGAYGSMGDYINSVSALKKGLTRFPDSELLVKNLAVSYYRKGDYEKAISVLERIPFQDRKEDSDISRLLEEARQMLKSRSHY